MLTESTPGSCRLLILVQPEIRILVLAAKPAKEGEILWFRHGTRSRHPSVEIGKPCPSNPVAVEKSPLEVTVNGEPAEIFGVDYPCAVDGYQVNFRIPADMVPGTATIQLTAAWISSIRFGL